MQKSTPREVFMYLLGTIALYFSAYSTINLLLQYINIGFPDPLNPAYNAAGSIRLSLAFLVILYPVYMWVARTLSRDITTDPSKRDLRVRKWLLYLTLFLAALLMIGDLVTLIYNFLQGEITVRFLLKVASVLAVAGAIFWYYLYDLRKEPGAFSAKALWFVRGTTIALLAIFIGGIFIAGSPFKQRLVKFDDQKVSDLQTIQGEVVNFWQQKHALPKALTDLRDPISGFIPPSDPQSGSAYDYHVTGTLAFELCANFNLSSAQSQVGTNAPVAPYPYGAYMDNWTHGAGVQCFSRTIDPQRYPPVPTK